MITTIEEYIERWEGFRSKPYRCTKNKLTIGIGRNIQENPLNAVEYKLIFPTLTLSQAQSALLNGITRDQALLLLRGDIRKISDRLNKYQWFTILNEYRKWVIIDLVFTMGSGGFLAFHNTLRALRERDYNKAADEIMNSRYYRELGDTTKDLDRGEANVSIMRSGRLPDQKLFN
jgi:lysozyme